MGLAFLALLWLGTVGLGKRTIRMVSYFDESVQGLDVGSVLKFRGGRIGNVAEISIAPDRRHVAVTSEVEVGALNRLGFRPNAGDLLEGIMPLDLRVRLVSLGITGLKFLEVDIFDPTQLTTPELPFQPAPNHFPSTPSVLKSAEEGLMEVLNRFPELEQQAIHTLQAAEEALQTARTAVLPFAEENTGLVNLVTAFEDAVASLDTAATSLDHELRTANVNATTAAIRGAADAVADAAHEATGLSGEMRDELLAVRELIRSLQALASHLERDPSALLRGRSSEPAPPTRNP
jgi:paraquat-inducible protein B